VNYKMALIDLGSFDADAGQHVITIEVRDFVSDRGDERFISQGIDALMVSRVSYMPRPETLPLLGEDVVRVGYDVDPATPEYPGQWLSFSSGDWTPYGTLSARVKITGKGEHWQGRLRAMHRGSEFRDMILNVPGRRFGEWCEFSFDLDEVFSGVSREAIHGLWLYTYSKWYTRPARVEAELTELTLSGLNQEASKTVLAPARGAPPPGSSAATDGMGGDAFVWNDPMTSPDDGGPPGGAGTHASGSKPIRLRSGELEAGFDPATCGLVNLSFGGRSLVSASVAQPLVTVGFLRGQRGSATGSGRLKRRWGRLVYSERSDAAEVEIEMSRGEPGEIWIDVTVGNRSDVPVSAVVLPALTGIGLGGDASDDTWVLGSRIYPPGDLSGSRSLVSPQLFTHDSVCAYDAESAFFFRVEDRHTLDSRVTFGREGGTGFVRLLKNPRILPGDSWRAPRVVIGADSKGSWHRSADRFRDWWSSWAGKAYIPEWFQKSGGLFVGYDVLGEDAVEANALALRGRRDSCGLFLGHTGQWLPLQTEAWYPHGYDLSPEQLRHFRTVSDSLRREGGRLSIYTNPLMFSRVIPEYELSGRDLTVVARDGYPVFSEHHMRHHPMALPFPSQAWAKRFADCVAAAVVLGRPDMLYMDQLGAVPSHLDFRPEAHQHTHYGEWVAGQAAFTRTVLARLRPEHPELVTAIEGINVAALQHVTFALLFDGSHEVFRFTFPHAYAAVGHYGTGTADQWLAYARTAFLTGQPVLLLGLADGADESTLALVKAMVCFKQENDPRLYGGVYRDTLGLTVPEGISARVFVTDSELLVPYVNPDRSVGEILLAPSALGLDSPAQRMAVPDEPFGLLEVRR
jgi:hypothetical protein